MDLLHVDLVSIVVSSLHGTPSVSFSNDDPSGGVLSYHIAHKPEASYEQHNLRLRVDILYLLLHYESLSK